MTTMTAAVTILGFLFVLAAILEFNFASLGFLAAMYCLVYFG